jgi:hypothetical protein
VKKTILMILGLGVFVLFPHFALSECLHLGGFTSWSLEGSNTAVFYNGAHRMARFDLQCDVEPTSKIELIKSAMCDGDEVLVDGSKCTIMGVYGEVNPVE